MRNSKTEKRISLSDLFIVLGTKYYLENLRSKDTEILNQIKMAYELGKPFFIIIDSRLSNEEKAEMKEYFSVYDVVKQLEVDIGKESELTKVAKELKKLAKDKSINLLFADSDL